jgi:hypothetical protein
MDPTVERDDEAGDVLIGDGRLVRLAGPLFALLSLCLIPWTIYLAIALPSRQLSRHYDVAWAGFDVMLLAALGASAYFALRRSPYLALSTSAAGTMLVVDAWFDILTSRAGADRMMAIVFAVGIELPLAGLCWWLSRQTEAFVNERLTLLLHPRRRTRSDQSTR